MNNNRERLGSRLGFILLSAGCAIGCGNVWKFPYLTGQNGGGAFVLLYIIFLIILGIPVMTMEFSIGRGSQKSPLKMLTTLQGKKQHWGWSSPLPFIGNVVLMMFYTCVAGWFLKYFVGFVSGEYAGLSAEQSGEAFGAMISNPGQQILFTAIICVIGFLICSFSLNKGLEQVTKYMMLILFLLLIVLVIHSCTLSGAKEGLTFYLLPDFTKITWGTVNAAMNQAFFTLSLGIGSMAIFGSYLDKKRSLMGESINVIILDTIVAIMAGLIIFPACSTFGVDAGAGPSLIFVTLPNIFANMAGGRIWGSLFFLFMTFAALSTVLAVFENILAMFRDWTGVSRVKGCIICGIHDHPVNSLHSGLQCLERLCSICRRFRRAGSGRLHRQQSASSDWLLYLRPVLYLEVRMGLGQFHCRIQCWKRSEGQKVDETLYAVHSADHHSGRIYRWSSDLQLQIRNNIEIIKRGSLSPFFSAGFLPS